jgi:hypothetical protein
LQNIEEVCRGRMNFNEIVIRCRLGIRQLRHLELMGSLSMVSYAPIYTK